MIFDPIDFDARLLEDFPRDGIFERLSGFDESRDGGIAPDRP